MQLYAQLRIFETKIFLEGIVCGIFGAQFQTRVYTIDARSRGLAWHHKAAQLMSYGSQASRIDNRKDEDGDTSLASAINLFLRKTCIQSSRSEEYFFEIIFFRKKSFYTP